MNRIWATTFAGAFLLTLGTAHAQGDAEKGKRVFNKCKACHAVGENAANRIGPPLNNIIGARAATKDYNYSPSMKEKAGEGLTWTEEKLSEYLENPKAVVPRGKMAFPGLKKDSDRENVIAYLKTFSETQ